MLTRIRLQTSQLILKVDKYHLYLWQILPDLNSIYREKRLSYNNFNSISYFNTYDLCITCIKPSLPCWEFIFKHIEPYFYNTTIIL